MSGDAARSGGGGRLRRPKEKPSPCSGDGQGCFSLCPRSVSRTVCAPRQTAARALLGSANNDMLHGAKAIQHGRKHRKGKREVKGVLEEERESADEDSLYRLEWGETLGGWSASSTRSGGRAHWEGTDHLTHSSPQRSSTSFRSAKFTIPSPVTSPSRPGGTQGDINDDGHVNFPDLEQLLEDWGHLCE